MVQNAAPNPPAPYREDHSGLVTLVSLAAVFAGAVKYCGPDGDQKTTAPVTDREVLSWREPLPTEPPAATHTKSLYYETIKGPDPDLDCTEARPLRGAEVGLVGNALGYDMPWWKIDLKTCTKKLVEDKIRTFASAECTWSLRPDDPKARCLVTFYGTDMYEDDYGAPRDLQTYATAVHELTHTWQYFKAEGLSPNCRSYTHVPGTPLTHMCKEAAAEAIALVVTYYTASSLPHLVEKRARYHIIASLEEQAVTNSLNKKVAGASTTFWMDSQAYHAAADMALIREQVVKAEPAVGAMLERIETERRKDAVAKFRALMPRL